MRTRAGAKLPSFPQVCASTLGAGQWYTYFPWVRSKGRCAATRSARSFAARCVTVQDARGVGHAELCPAGCVQDARRVVDAPVQRRWMRPWMRRWSCGTFRAPSSSGKRSAKSPHPTPASHVTGTIGNHLRTIIVPYRHQTIWRLSNHPALSTMRTRTMTRAGPNILPNHSCLCSISLSLVIILSRYKSGHENKASGWRERFVTCGRG